MLAVESGPAPAQVLEAAVLEQGSERVVGAQESAPAQTRQLASP